MYLKSLNCGFFFQSLIPFFLSRINYLGGDNLGFVAGLLLLSKLLLDVGGEGLASLTTGGGVGPVAGGKQLGLAVQAPADSVNNNNIDKK